MLCNWKICVLVIFGVVWIPEPCSGDNDFATCSFTYREMDWYSAVRKCERSNMALLCYKSEKYINDITAAFRLSAFEKGEVGLWISRKNCSETKNTECLSLHTTTRGKVWHYYQEDCAQYYPFVCCIKEIEQTTTFIPTEVPTQAEVTSITYDPPTEKPPSTTLSTDISTFSSSVHPYHCKKIRRRGILWPDTDFGEFAIQPCPGNSVGSARWLCGDTDGGTWSQDGPDLLECRSLEFRNLKEKYNTSLASETIISLEKLFLDEEKEIFSEDLVDVISMLTTLPDRLFQETESHSSTSRWTSTKISIEKSALVFDRMIQLNTTWQDIPQKRRSAVGTYLLSTVDELGLLLADAMIEDVAEQSVIGKNIALQVVKTAFGESLQLPQWDAASSFSHLGNVLLGKGYDSYLDRDKGNISVVFAVYGDVCHILPSLRGKNKDKTPSTLNSAVVSTTVSQGRKPIVISSEVRISVEHLVLQPNDTACVFWNIQRNNWDTSGCRLDSTNGSYSTCVCDHLTNFAVLMDYRSVLDQTNQLPFHYITVIGCALSVVCLTLCIIVFTFYSYRSKHSWALRYIIHRNLCLTLLIANLVLIFGLDKTGNQKVCAVVAGLLHYFFLSAFSWMLLEGVHIYLLLVVVFASRRSHWEKYYLFGYGFPIVIVAITAISRPMYYGTDEICWLSTEKGTIWGFMGPVACILLVNTAALTLAQWKASKVSVKDDNVALIKRWLRVTVILFPVLGITWIFGFLYVGKHFEVVGYIFAVLNSLQGFCIFVCHCLLDKKARNMVVASFNKKTSSVSTGSSGTQKKRDPKLPNGSMSSPKGSEDKSKWAHLSFRKNCGSNWIKFKRPWSFCFDLPVSEPGNEEVQKEHPEELPRPVVVQWNNLDDRTC